MMTRNTLKELDMKKKLISGLFVAAAIVSLAACGSSESTTTSSSSADTETFTYAIDGDPSSTNPLIPVTVGA